MTTNITELASHMRGLAEAATPGPHHIYTNHRDDNNWQNNEAWHAACEPQAIITILDALEAAQAEVAKQKHSITILKSINDIGTDCIKELEAERDAALARLAEIEAGASLEPSALQAANEELITALAACRDAFPVPDAGSRLDDWFCSAMADPLEVPDYVKACVGASPQPSQAVELVTSGGGYPGDHNGRHVAELKAASILLRRSEGPVTFSTKKLQIADAIDAIIAAINAKESGK